MSQINPNMHYNIQKYQPNFKAESLATPANYAYPAEISSQDFSSILKILADSEMFLLKVSGSPNGTAPFHAFGAIVPLRLACSQTEA